MPDNPRIDAASRIINASPQAIYQSFLDPQALAAWRPPKGMTARIFAFEPREGGRYRMAFEYEDASEPGKSADNTDVFEGRFVELVPGRRIVEVVTFESDDPRFAGEMTITTTLEPVDGGTRVTSACSDVPEGISPEDHEAGIASSLENLAAFVEGDA